MKSIIKGFIVAAVMFSFAAFANAEESNVVKKPDNISFDYGNNTFSVTETTTIADKTELTIMLVKGDYVNSSLDNVQAADICYVGQAGGCSYVELFGDKGVRYTNGDFEPGVYTLITSGQGVTPKKTKIFLGNAVDADLEVSKYMHTYFGDKNVEFGTTNQSIKVYENSNNYIYVGVGEFNINNTVTPDKLGFVVQKKENGGALKKGYQSLKELGVEALENVGSVYGVFNVGIQINGIVNTTDVVAIPYVVTD